MSLEERIQQSVAHALDEAHTRMEAEVRALVQDVIGTAAQEQEAAVTTARDAALDEAGTELRRALVNVQARAAQDLASTVAAVRISERDAEMASHARPLDAIRELDAAESLTEVLARPSASRET